MLVYNGMENVGVIMIMESMEKHPKLIVILLVMLIKVKCAGELGEMMFMM